MSPSHEGGPGQTPGATSTTTVDGVERVLLTIPQIDPDATNLEAALAYAAVGIYVLPAKRGTKDPGTVVGKWRSKSSRDPKVIAGWFAGTDHDIAWHCGRSGLLVFDVDSPADVPEVLARHLWSAPYQATRSHSPGRGHSVFAMPPGRTLGNRTGGLGGGWGEVRGDNGIIIVANSFHADGGRYRWERTGLIPVLPDEIADLLPDVSSATDAATDADVRAFLATHTEATRPEILCGWVKALRNKFETGSRHVGAVSVTVGALKEARAGYLSAQEVLDTLMPMFVVAATRAPTGGEHQRTEAEARDEYRSIFAWCVAQANAANLDEVRARTNGKMPDNVTFGKIDSNGSAPPAVTAEAMNIEKHSGHLGMAVKMGKYFVGKLLYVNKIGWHRWDGKRWSVDGDGTARRAVHQVIQRDRQIVKRLELSSEEEEKRLRQIARFETASAISGILTEAAALQVFSVEVGDLDADPFLFNCANGTYDLRTGKLGGHDAADRITKVAIAAYHADAVGPAWVGFLDKVLPDREVRDYQQRLFGISLVGEVNGDKQILPIMVGGGANGKTTAIESVSFALGDYATTAEPTLLMEKRNDAHPTGVADLLGRRFVSVCETEQRRRFDIALVKRLTGGDTLKARFMRQDYFQFDPTYLLMLATNHLPRIDDDTEAVWRRIRVIPYTVQIPADERDQHLGERLRSEADAVLTWVIDGWQDYRRGGLREPDAVMVATGAYKADSDAVGRFIADECAVGGMQSAATTQALYDRWLSWAAQDGCLPLSRIAFGRTLDAKGFPAENTHQRLRRRICVKPPEVQVNG